MSSFTYLSKAVVAATTTGAEEVALHHIRRLSSSSSSLEEEPRQWAPFKNELDFRLAAFVAGIVTISVGVCILHFLLKCFNCHPNDDDLPASFQPAPRRISPVIMSIEPALIFTNGLTLAGGTDHPECIICLSEFVEGDEIRILSNCRHGFHQKCIETWLQSSRSSSCPTCRTGCAKTSVSQNPPENHHQQQQQQPPNDIDLEAANRPEIEMMVPQQQQQHEPNDVDLEAANQLLIEMMVPQQQQQNDVHEAVNLRESDIVVLQQQQ